MLVVAVVVLTAVMAKIFGWVDGGKSVQPNPQTITEVTAVVPRSDLVVAEQWGCKRVVFTTCENGKLDHVFVEFPSGEEQIFYADRVVGKEHPASVEWKTWLERFEKLKRGAMVRQKAVKPPQIRKGREQFALRPLFLICLLLSPAVNLPCILQLRYRILNGALPPPFHTFFQCSLYYFSGILGSFLCSFFFVRCLK